jgi:hypothetical protein
MARRQGVLKSMFNIAWVLTASLKPKSTPGKDIDSPSESLSRRV